MMKLPSTQNMSTAQVIRRAAVIAIISMIAWIAGCAILWGIFQIVGIRFDFWPMLEALSTAAAVAQFLGGGIVALWQLRDSADSRNMSIFNDVFSKLMSDREIEARRWIYTQLPDDPGAGLASLSPEGQEHIKHVLNSFDHLGFLLERDWITAEGEGSIVKWVSPMVVKTWAKLGPYIEFEAKRRNEPDYYENVRFIAKRCIEWRTRNMPGAEVTWVDGAL